MTKQNIHTYWTTKLKQDAREKQTLQFLNIDALSTQQPHTSIATVENTPKDVQRAAIKSRLLTGNYKLAAVEAHHSRGALPSLCPLCKLSTEDITHFLLTCPKLATVRERYLAELCKTLPNCYSINTWNSLDKVQLILDATLLMSRGQLPHSDQAVSHLERVSRRMCYALHCRRAHLMKEDQERGTAATRNVPNPCT
jgi:hypothetical protein